MRTKWLAIATVSLMAAGCLQDVTTPRRNVPINGDILIGLTEKLPERSLTFACRTQQTYPCFNYILDCSLAQRQHSIRLDFNRVIAPSVCLTAIGPARAQFDLGALAPGSTSLALRTPLGDVNGLIEVSEGSYRALVPEGAARFDDPTLQRIPEGTVWGFFGYAGPEMEPVARAVIDEMASLGAMPRTLAEGRYSVSLPGYNGDTFQADVSGAIHYDDNTGYYHVLPFALSFGGDTEALRDLVARTGREHGDLLHLRIYTWRGDAFFSWVLGRA